MTLVTIAIMVELNMKGKQRDRPLRRTWEWEEFSQRWRIESWRMTRNKVGVTFFYTIKRCLIGHYRWWNLVFSIRAGDKTPGHAVENTEFTSAEKVMHISLAVQYRGSVLLWSQGDSSLLIHCTRPNGESAVLFGSADKWILHHDNASAMC
jgi:hypothetical protein